MAIVGDIGFHWTYKELKRKWSWDNNFISSAFIEPIRNWNLRQWSQSFISSVFFHWTYKELKHAGASTEHDQNLHFHWTYKELKRSPTLSSLPTLSSFHWTYKELKQENTNRSNQQTRTFIEPIRNWNIGFIKLP